MSLAEGYSVSRYTTLGQPVLSAYLWNPPTDRIEVRYPYKDNIDIERLEPALVLAGHGFRDGDGALHYALRANERIFEQGELRVGVRHGWFEVRITPSSPFPEATSVDWSLGSDQDVTHSGTAQLRWSRFQGVVRYRDGNWRSSHIDMRPVGWGGTPTNFTVPVMDNGSFDVLVPARVYGIVNVNGSGYGYDALERWAWDYDLTVDRHDEFIIGRTELYGMRAFDTKGGPSTLFVIFRPTALSRLLRFDADGDGLVQGTDVEKQLEAMRRSATAIGPELTSGDITVWYDGRRRDIVQLNMIPEACGDTWQVQYLLQFAVDDKPPRGVWKEIKVEVTSRESLHGKDIIDYGQGSVGICLP